MLPEKTLYTSLKDMFFNIQNIIKIDKMIDTSLIFYNYSHSFELTYSKKTPMKEYPDMKIMESKPLKDIFALHYFELNQEADIQKAFIKSLVSNISINKKTSWKKFINDNFQDSTYLMNEYKKEEIENLNEKLHLKLKPKSNINKKIKI